MLYPPRYALLGFLALAVFVSRSRALTVAGPDSGHRRGGSASATVVEGRPAIAWSDVGAQRVNYVRAADAAGIQWEAPVAVVADAGPETGNLIKLLIANGNPAVAYVDTRANRIMFARALNATGTRWGAPFSAGPTGVAPDFFTACIVDGNPALCFVHNSEIIYLRAQDSGGGVWGTPVTIGSGAASGGPELKIVNGFPAVAWAGPDGQLRYSRALDATGTAWSPGVSANAKTHSAVISMEMVSGRPAIFHPSESGMMYVRAADNDGTAWDAPVRLDTGPDQPGGYTSLTVANGRPAVCWHTTNTGVVMYTLARDSTGDTAAAWMPPVMVAATGTLGEPVSLLDIQGRPALVYHHLNDGTLHYLRAVTDDGPVQWPPRISVTDTFWPRSYPAGGMINYGALRVGETSESLLMLSNAMPGCVPLNITGITFEGPDAAEFSITSAPAINPLPGGAYTFFSLKYQPLTHGLKQAKMRMHCNAEGPVASYDLNLTAFTVPMIEVLDSNKSPLADGAATQMPGGAPGRSTSAVFTIQNIGAYPLEGVGVTIDGLDAGEFSLTSPPNATVAYVDSTTFTVRHTPLTSGEKYATIHIASNTAGDLNPFDIQISTLAGLPDAFGAATSEPVTAIALQADGKILAGGRKGIERFNPDGTPDTTFFAPALSASAGNAAVGRIAVERTGDILISGNFREVEGQLHPVLARLRGDGTVDAAFTPLAGGGVNSLVLQPDGNFLAGGSFRLPGNAAQVYLARFHPDGTRDSGFTPDPPLTTAVTSLALDTGGKILLGGGYSVAQPTPGVSVARLHSDGKRDEAFSPPFSAEFPGPLLVQPDGKILVGSTYSGGPMRLFPDGTIDPSLAVPALNGTNFLALQADGKLITTRPYELPAGHIPFYRRFFPDGSPDTTFGPPVTGLPMLFYSAAAMMEDGRLLSSGFISGTLSRLENGPAYSLLRAEGTHTLRWFRDGTAPEVQHVFFESRAAGAADWSPRGAGRRISGGWELIGLSLPVSGSVRARGFAAGSVYETVAPLPSGAPPSALETWRTVHFGTTANAGNASNDADPDRDGITNFIEFAFGLSPMNGASRHLPGLSLAEGKLVTSFTAPPGLDNELRYGAEWSSTLDEGSWTAIPDSGTAGMHTFSVQKADERKFVRFTVRVR